MGPNARHFRHCCDRPAVGARRSGLRGAIAAGCILLGTLVTAADEGALPPPPRLPEAVRTPHTTFAIPFRVAPPQQADQAATRVFLQASKDLGATWEQAGEAAPDAKEIVYRAGRDGEYWFRLRALDSKGRQRGGEGPDMRVIVDAAAPRLAARVWRGADGEVACRYAAADDTLDLPKVLLEYRTKDDATWKRVAAEPILSRESPAHLIGEEIWWAGEKPEGLQVRIAVSDAAGHRTVKQFAMEASDPGVDQSALAAEIGAPVLPGQPGGDVVAASPPPSVPAESASGFGNATEPPVPSTTPPGGWAADTSTRWAGEAPATEGAPARSVLAKPVATGPLPQPPAPPAGAVPAPEAPIPSPNPAIEAAAPMASTRTLPTEYRGRPLQIVGSRRFAWEYEMQVDRPDAGPVRVELWSTRDGGVTWQRAAVDDDRQSPIDVTLPAPGLYGFRLEIVADVPEAGTGPRPGEMPEGWVGVDDEPPQVEVVDVTRLPETDGPGVLVRWVARDQILVPGSVRLLHSPSPEGPWATIAEGLDAQGERRWVPERGVPARVWIRAEASDAAGNVGRGTTSEAVTIAVPRVVGKLGGVKVLPPTGTP